jgi:hypothetical protein
MRKGFWDDLKKHKCDVRGHQCHLTRNAMYERFPNRGKFEIYGMKGQTLGGNVYSWHNDWLTLHV